MSEQQEAVQEEYVENRATGVEVENTDSETRSDKPWNPNDIRVDPKTFSLRQIIDMINDKEIDLAPDFQRHRVWKQLQKSRLIESILLRIPLPAFYFSSDKEGKMQVVDGLQRLSTISSFANGEFPLDDLEYLQSDLRGKFFADLKDSVWIRRLNQTQILVNVIDPQTPIKVKFDIFKRINTGGEPLNAQEIRHCMSQKTSRDFLKSCTELPSFKDGVATGELRAHVRMADREVVLRFCAFLLLENLEEYGNSESMDVFLTEANEKLDRMSQPELDSLRQSFDKALQNAQSLFGKHAFRKWPASEKKDLSRNPFNKAFFEALTVGLARYDWPRLEPRREEIVKAARQVMRADRAFNDAISFGTGALRKVRLRFLMVREILEKAGTGQALRTSEQLLEASRS
jgi:hypothetical protein